ncbi:zona pellucida glycoprotein 3d tandem duplicate 1 [Paramisgurnus dabryanus]|uniref:zona pellucida glycoprotein 3d tandem duplicate 1 n=1 Tax=Paramisgurnus dabryanus TaxID=90735 RepID=UPI0031F3EC7E
MMGRPSLNFCCPLYFLVLFIPKIEMFGGPPKYSKLVSTEQKALPMSGGFGPWTGDSEFNKPPPVMRPYHVFPMFDHVPVPLVDMELFRPVPGRRHMPSILSSLLIPQVNPQRIQVSPVRNTRGVEVWCGYSKVSVRVNRKLLGFRSSPASFYLGTCSSSRSDNSFIYFHYDLNQCGSSLTMMNGQIMYSNTIQYIPEPQGTVIRAVPLTLNVQCLYNRFHYSYKMGYLPVIREHMFRKSFESSVKFTISVCNERWEILGENESFMLGEPMYFEVSAARIFEEERVFIDSCYATASKDPNSTPKHSVIHNYGCMEDSRRDASLSRFIQRESNFIRFSVDAFLLPQVTGTHFHLHCLVSVHNTTASVSAKSCTYNNITEIWEELYADASVCACCEATCEVKTKSSFPHVTHTLITSKSWILNKTEESHTQREMREWDSRRDGTKDVKFKGAQGINEEDDYTEEIVTDPKEQMETREKDKEMLVNDEEIKAIAGTEAAFTLSEFQKKVAGRPGKVVFLGQRTEKRTDTDAGSVRSTITTDTVEKPSVQFSDQPLEDANNDTKSSESVPKEETISKDEMQSDDLEENTRIQSTIQSQMVIDEDVFLNSKQEPKEWNEDAD